MSTARTVLGVLGALTMIGGVGIIAGLWREARFTGIAYGCAAFFAGAWFVVVFLVT